MSDEERAQYSVFVFLADGHFPVERFVDMERAMRSAKRAIRAGLIIDGIARAERVIVVDGGDHCIFEWQRDKGVTWPPPPKEAA